VINQQLVWPKEYAAAAALADADLERARRFFIRACQSHNAAGPGGAGWSVPEVQPKAAGGRNRPALRFANLVDALPRIARAFFGDSC
jgi:hypothetical protein